MEISRRRTLFGIRLTKLRIALLSVAILALVLTLGLRGAVPAQTIQVVDGSKYLQPILGEGNVITGYTDDLQNWAVNESLGVSTTEATTRSSGLVINGTFGANIGRQTISVSKEIPVNITEFPIMDLQFNLSGTTMVASLFVVEPNATQAVGSVALVGNGTLQEIKADVFNGKAPSGSKLLVEFQANEGLGTSQVKFFLQIKSMEFLGYPLSQMRVGGTFHAAFLTFNSSLPLGNSSWPLDHVTLDATVSASVGSTYELFLINNSKIYGEGTYKFSSTTAEYEYTLTPQQLLSESQIQSFNGSLYETGGMATIAIVATSGYLYNVSAQYERFVLLAAPEPNSSISIPSGLDGYLYAYLVSFLFILPLLGIFYFYQKFRGGKFNQRHIILAVLLGAVSRLAMAPITSHPYDTLVNITSARAWFQYGIPNISLGPTLPLTFFLYRVPYSFYALLQLTGLQDLHFMGHAQGMLETVFIKGFPMVSDYVVFYFLSKFDKNDSKTGTLFGVFYLLNPLSIYVSAVWGQYEAATMAFVVIGFWTLVNKQTGARMQLFASITLTVSAMIELFAVIPLALLIIRSFFAKPFKIMNTLVLAAPLLLFFVYEPEWHATYLVFLSAIGAVPVLGFSTPSVYSLAGAFPFIGNYHLLLISLFLVTLGFIVYGKYDIETVLTFTMGAFLSLLLFGNQLVQWWELVLPLAFLIAVLTKKHGLGIFMPVFGTLVTFVALSYTQGSGFMTLGKQQLDLVPLIESVKNSIPIYVLSTAVATLLLVFYLIRKPSSWEHTMRNTSLLLMSVFLVEFVVMGRFGLW